MNDLYLYFWGDGRVTQLYRVPTPKERQLIRQDALRVYRLGAFGYMQYRPNGSWERVSFGPYLACSSTKQSRKARAALPKGRWILGTPVIATNQKTSGKSDKIISEESPRDHLGASSTTGSRSTRPSTRGTTK